MCFKSAVIQSNQDHAKIKVHCTGDLGPAILNVEVRKIKIDYKGDKWPSIWNIRLAGIIKANNYTVFYILYSVSQRDYPHLDNLFVSRTPRDHS